MKILVQEKEVELEHFHQGDMKKLALYLMQKADEIANLIPGAKVTYAHGQMTGHEIEDIMEELEKVKF